MITRIVKMTFFPDLTEDFLKIFNESKSKIRGFEGCKGVNLLFDVKQNNIYFTYSNWESEVHLENYRKSDLFLTTWQKTKILFCDKPEAWSIKDTQL